MNTGTMGVNSLPKTVTRQRRGCDLNPGPSAPEFSTLTTRLPSHPTFNNALRYYFQKITTFWGMIFQAHTAVPDSGVREYVFYFLFRLQKRDFLRFLK